MKNKGIVIFLIVLAVLIVAVMVGDFYSKRPDNMEANAHEYSVDEFRHVPDELIQFKETRNFKLGFTKPKGITIQSDKIFLAGDQMVKVIDLNGHLLKEFELPEEPHTLEVADDKIYVAFENQIRVYDTNGSLLQEWGELEDNTYLTAIAAYENDVYVADAGTRKIIKYSPQGEKILEFEGKASEDVLHGFIVPSPYFDIGINEFGELWVVNPGMHSLENYSEDGNLRGFWKQSGMTTETFSGCCNPAHYAFLPDGSFVTSEKGLVRIKIYKPSGEFVGVVAPPDKFEDKIEAQAPDVAVDSQGNVYALDFDRNVLRVFQKKSV